MATTFNHNDQVYVKDGKMGINTSTPDTKLDIESGSIKIGKDLAAADFDAINIAYRGSWSGQVNKLAGINVTDSDTLSQTVGRFGVTYNGSSGVFIITDLYSSGYGGSGDVFRAVGSGDIVFPQYGAGLLKTDANGVISLDTATYITGSSDTLATVTGRGNTTTQNIEIVHSTGQGFYSGPDAFSSFGSGVSTILLQGTQANGRAGALWFKGVNGDDVAALYVTDDTQDNYGTTLVAYSGSMRFATQTLGAEKMTIAANGYVGIGTESPASRLHVRQDGNSGLLLKSQNSDTGTSAYVEHQLQSGTSGRELRIGASHNYNSTEWNNAWVYAINRDLALKTNSGVIKTYANGTAESNVITTTNQYGVGIKDVPASNQRLVVDTPNGVWGLLMSSGSVDYGGLHINNGVLSLQSDGASAINLATANVGINTVDPQDRLHVQSGNIRITNSSPILYFYDSDVANLRHRILGGGNAGLEYSADIGNVTSGYHRWDIANSEKMRLVESGRLGIGTTDPDTLLHVYGGGAPAIKIEAVDTSSPSMTAHMIIQGYDGRGKGIFLADSGSNADREIFFGSTYSGGNANFTVGYENDGTGQAEYKAQSKFYIDLESGNVGISNTNPQERLHVYSAGTAATRIEVENTSGFAAFKATNDSGSYGWYVDDSSDSFRLFDFNDSADRVTVLGDGNVGIGTTSPSADLHIADTNSDVLVKIHAITGANDPILEFQGNSNDITVEGFQLWYDNSVGDMHLATTYANDDAAIRFHTRTGASKSTNNERLTIAGNGNVGIGATSPDGRLDVRGGKVFLSPSGNGSSGTNSNALIVRNLNDTAYTADAINAYNNHTSYDIDTKAVFTVAARANGAGSLYTYSGENTTEPAATNRFVQLKSTNTGPLHSWIFYQWDGSGNTAADLKRPNKLWTISTYENSSASEKLSLSGSGQLQLSEYGSGNFTGTAAYKLSVDSSGNIIEQAIGAGAVDGSGTANYVTKWSDSDTLTDSSIYDNGSVHINGSNPLYNLDVNGTFGVGGGTNSSNTYMYDSYTDGTSAYFHQPKASIRLDNGATGSVHTAPVSLFLHNENGTDDTWVKLSMGSREVNGGGNTVSLAGIAAQKVSGTSGNWARGNLHLWTKNNATMVDAMTIKYDGNVGIGTSSPTTKLDVNGNIRVDDEVQFTRGGGDYSNYIRSQNYPSEGYTSATAKYWLEYGAKGGHHFVVNTDGGSGSAENDYDDFTIWQGQVDGDRLFEVRNTGNAYIAGSVGIGTTSSSYKLTVQGASNGINLAGTGAFLRWNSGDIQISNEGSYKMGFYTYNAGAAALVNRMVIDTNGSVGIGTASPTSILHVENAGNTWAKFVNSSGTNQRLDVGTNSSDQHFVYGYGAYPLLLGTNGNTRATITSGGNVGIGTTVPSAKLEVYQSGSTALDIQGSQGQLFSVTDSLSGSLMSVNDITGIPILEVFSDDKVVAGQFGTNALVVKGANVGIGTGVPSHKLRVEGRTLINSGNGASTFNDLSIGGVDGWSSGEAHRINFVYGNNGGDIFQTIESYYNGSNTGRMRFRNFYTDAAQTDILMTIHSNGNVGIGADDPAAHLEIRSAGSEAGGAEIRLQHGNNNSTDVVSTVNFANNVGSVAMIQGGTTSGNTNGYIALFTDNAGSSSEKMRIKPDGQLQLNAYGAGILQTDASGNVTATSVVGTATNANNVETVRDETGTGAHYLTFVDDNNATAAYEQLYTNSGLYTTPNNSALYSNGEIIAYASSDEKLKDNIVRISRPLEKVQQIGGYTFDWNDKQDVYKGHDIGVIAQEIEKVLPEIVTTRKDGYKAVKYEKVVPLLIEAVKEQQQQIDELKEMVKVLMNK